MENRSTFRSKWFVGLVTILEIDEAKNILHVSIDPQKENRSIWTEEWNLSATRYGFTLGDYYDLAL